MNISASTVKELRVKTGAGVMDCKKALEETDGDIDKAVEYLRKQGIASAAKRSHRETKEGLIFSYIHPGNRLGVLIEVNCETDFVARTDEFRELTKNLAMQIAAANPLSVNRENLPQDLVEKEKEIYWAQAKESGKPDNIIERIIDGKMDKFYQEVCLLEQPFIKDPEKNVGSIIVEAMAKIGENISVKRFVRYRLGDEE